MSSVRRADVERKEFARETTLFHPLDVGLVRERWFTSEIKVVVGHPGSDVVVSIDNNSATMDRERSLPETFVSR
jgi:hypothetical protein